MKPGKNSIKVAGKNGNTPPVIRLEDYRSEKEMRAGGFKLHLDGSGRVTMISKTGSSFKH